MLSRDTVKHVCDPGCLAVVLDTVKTKSFRFALGAAGRQAFAHSLLAAWGNQTCSTRAWQRKSPAFVIIAGLILPLYLRNPSFPAPPPKRMQIRVSPKCVGSLFGWLIGRLLSLAMRHNEAQGARFAGWLRALRAMHQAPNRGPFGSWLWVKTYCAENGLPKWKLAQNQRSPSGLHFPHAQFPKEAPIGIWSPSVPLR